MVVSFSLAGFEESKVRKIRINLLFVIVEMIGQILPITEFIKIHVCSSFE